MIVGHDPVSWKTAFVPIEGDRWITGGEIASEVPVVGVFTPLSVNVVLSVTC